MSQSLAAKTSINLYKIGALSYAASRIAYCSNIRNLFVDSALRYASLLCAPQICRNIKSNIDTLLNPHVINKKQPSFQLLLSSLLLAWTGSTALVPAGEQLFSGLSAHLNSASQIGSGGMALWSAYQNQPGQTLQWKIGSQLFGEGSIPAYFLLITPTLINTPLFSSSFSPRFASALGIANLCYQQFRPAQTRKR